MKKKWEKPELVILVRSKSEEAVLNGCKVQYGQIGGPGWAQGCKWTAPECSAMVSS